MAWTYLVSYSGGLSSFAAAWEIKRQGFNMELIFCDTLIEDEDLYRFLKETAVFLGLELTTLSDGRTPWEVFKDVRYIGNSRTAPCSTFLKREIFRKYIEDGNYTPEETILVLGFDVTEAHRVERAKENWQPYGILAPLIERVAAKREALEALKKVGIEIPRLYKMGFQHNNCGGFCVRAGQAQFQKLLEIFPERYAEHEASEQKLLAEIPTTRPFLRRIENGKKKYLSLKQFRESDKQESFDFGGCGCFAE